MRDSLLEKRARKIYRVWLQVVKILKSHFSIFEVLNID